MARQEIPLGSPPSGEGGATAREAFGQVNQMTAELYAADVAHVAAIAGKVDKLAGMGLSETSFTQGEKDKLAALESSHYKGTFLSLADLTAAIPVGVPGDYADVDAGAGQQVHRALWDDSDSEWVLQTGEGGLPTAAQVKELYEANPDTNPLTNARKQKLDGIAANATANATDAQLRDRSTHTGTQLAATISDLAAAVRAVTLAGINSSNGAITSGDTILSALGKTMGSFANALPRPTTTDGVTLFADAAAIPGWYDKLLGGPYTARQADHPDGTTPAGTLDAVNYYWVLSIPYVGNSLQVAFPYASAAPNGRERVKFRIKGGSSWGSWQPLTAGTTTLTTVDATPGRILKAGDGGWMGDVPVVTGSTNLDNRAIRGFRYYDNTVSGTQPSGVAYGIFNTFGLTDNFVSQEFWEISTTSALGRKWRRNCYANGAWSAWKETNADSDILPDIGESFINSPSLSTGRYRVVAGSSGYLPLGSNGYLDHYSMGGSNAKQEYTPFYSSRVFVRIYNSGGWSPWAELDTASVYETTVAWTAGATIPITHNLGVVPKMVVFEGVMKTAAFGLAIGERFESALIPGGGTVIYGQIYRKPTTTTLEVIVGNTGLMLLYSGGVASAVSAAQADLRIKVIG
ncbi:pyocin knob domain-containing protein [Pseudomonas tohonis]|uniref:pyocin knob domain-containing protein n=1 Tax=Pseudomonas tohonis TaxID=2725477 RepID=UPI001F2F0A0F|nr:pyocin knob domain-containing protein [Pseudomonas tohonis]